MDFYPVDPQILNLNLHQFISKTHNNNFSYSDNMKNFEILTIYNGNIGNDYFNFQLDKYIVAKKLTNEIDDNKLYKYSILKMKTKIYGCGIMSKNSFLKFEDAELEIIVYIVPRKFISCIELYFINNIDNKILNKNNIFILCIHRKGIYTVTKNYINKTKETNISYVMPNTAILKFVPRNNKDNNKDNNIDIIIEMGKTKHEMNNSKNLKENIINIINKISNIIIKKKYKDIYDIFVDKTYHNDKNSKTENLKPKSKCVFYENLDLKNFAIKICDIFIAELSSLSKIKDFINEINVNTTLKFDSGRDCEPRNKSFIYCQTSILLLILYVCHKNFELFDIITQNQEKILKTNEYIYPFKSPDNIIIKPDKKYTEFYKIYNIDLYSIYPDETKINIANYIEFCKNEQGLYNIFHGDIYYD